MILETLLNYVFMLFNFWMFFEIPDLPASVQGYVDTAFDYIVAGGGVLANYTPLPYLMTLFGLLLAVDAGILVYHLVMWVLRKIPALGIE